MKTKKTLLLVCLFLLAAGLRAQAQILWGAAVNIGAAGSGDVATNGYAIYAETWGNSGTTINGVSFIQDTSQTGDGNVAIAYAAGGVDKHGEGTGGSGTAYYNLTTTYSAYTALIQGTDWGANANPGTITLNNLTAGHNYQVQIWENDSHGGTYSGRNATFTSTGGNSVTLAYYVGGNGSSSPAGGLGQYAVGTFTAQGTNQTISLTGGGSNPADQLNSLQLRDVTPGLSPPVILTDNGNGTVTMNNGIVTVTCGKGGDVSYFALNALSTTNLINPNKDYGLILTHIGGQGNDYWVSVGSGGSGSTYSVVTNTPQMVDIMTRNPRASGNTALYPNGEWDWAEHHVMRAGEAGFYTYHVWRHWTNQPAAYYWADSWQGYCGSIFNTTTNADGSVNYAWDFSASDVPVNLLIASLPSLGTNPPNDAVPGEVAILPKTSYISQPTGNYYEPGWPIYTQPLGLTSDLYPTTTKYDQCSYLGASNTFRPVWGMATDQVGLWSILGSAEFINGGPTKQKGSVSGNYMYNDDAESHGLGSVNDPGVADGQVFTKVIGPYFMYANTGTNHLQLWTNAQNQAAIMVSNWPYAWMDESEQDYPRHRGMVAGTLKAKTGESTAQAVVILGDYTDGDWMYQGITNFLFWTTSDTNGNFSIPKVRPGNYQLFSYVPGIWGELQVSNIIVLPDQTNNLGVINWNPPHLSQRLWRIGTPDHSSAEFHLGNYRKQFGLWWRYLNDQGTNDVNFVIGQSVESNDWYYAQCSVATTPQSSLNLTDHTQTNGIYWSPHWNVLFNLTNLPPTPVLATIAFAGGNGTYFYMYLNGVNVTPDTYHGQGTSDGTDIYRDVVTVGRYQYYQFSFAANLFKVGTNTFTITVRQGGAPGTWTGSSYPELVQGGLIYDFLQMETGPQVIIANPPTAPIGLAAAAVSRTQINLVWTNTATNALSLEIERSTDGVNFAQIGAVLPGVTNYADASPPTGILCYYQVLANNVDGNSPASNIAQADTPPAPPANLNTHPVNSQITLNWSASLGATNYAIWRGTSSGNETNLVATTTNTTGTDTGVFLGVNYYYVVVAAGPFGSSLNSAEVNAAAFGARSLIWRGDGVANLWDLGNATNWQTANGPTYFDNGDTVTFDNTGSNNLPVALSGTLQPALVNVNANDNYTLNGSGANGSGSIGGTNSLVKSGTGTLTLAMTNTYTGGTIINAGTVNFAQSLNPNVVAALQPLLWFTFDQVGGGVVTNLGTGGAAMNGALDGANVSIVPGGRSGHCLAVGNGSLSGGYVLVSNAVTALDGTTAGLSWTVALWVKTATPGGAWMYQGSGGWVSGNTSFFLTSATQDAAGAAYPGGHVGGVRWGGGWMGGNSNVNDNNWHFIAITDNGGTKTIYVDGNVDASYTASQLWTTAGAGNQLWIGGSGDAGDGNAAFNGLIDEVCVFNTALSSAQILALMSSVNLTTGQLPAASAVSLATAGTLDFAGISQTVASLSDLGGGGGWVTNSAATNVTLVVSNNTANTSTFSGVINDAGNNAISLVKAGNYTQVLAGLNGFSGATTVAGGSLIVNGSLGGGAVAVVNSTLGGSGIISGPVTVQSGGALAPGNPLGTLTISNNLTLAAGSATLMQLQHSPRTNNAVNVSGVLLEGGTLIVTNLGAGALSAGDSFKLFNASNYTGSFAGFVLPPLTGNLLWNTNALPNSGTLSVVTLTAPTFSGVKLAGGNLVVRGAGGVNGWPFCLLVATNLAAAQWLPVATNQFDANGNFILTNPINAASAQTFYKLQLR